MRRRTTNTGRPGSGEHPGLTRVLVATRILLLAAAAVKLVRSIVTNMR